MGTDGAEGSLPGSRSGGGGAEGARPEGQGRNLAEHPYSDEILRVRAPTRWADRHRMLPSDSRTHNESTGPS